MGKRKREARARAQERTRSQLQALDPTLGSTRGLGEIVSVLAWNISGWDDHGDNEYSTQLNDGNRFAVKISEVNAEGAGVVKDLRIITNNHPAP